MKIGREDFEALMEGEKTLAPYIELDPLAGSYSVFGVRTASNPNYLVKSIYEMYEANLNRKLAVKAVRKLFRSVGMGSIGLNNLLKKQGMDLKPAEFPMLFFTFQHRRDGVRRSSLSSTTTRGLFSARNRPSNPRS